MGQASSNLINMLPNNIVRDRVHCARKKGASLVEVIVATAIILLILTSLYAAHIFYLRTVLSNLNKVKASFLLEEGIEAVKLIRDQSWTNISNIPENIDRHLYWSGTMWQATTTNIFVDGIFERKFTIAGVNRDGNDDIAQSGSSDDGTKKVTVTVSWAAGAATTSKSMSTYITNFLE